MNFVVLATDHVFVTVLLLYLSAEDLAKFDGLIDELCAWCDEKGKGVDVYPKVGALIAVKESGAEKWTRAKVTRLVSSE